jgi:hypothetical protein
MARGEPVAMRAGVQSTLLGKSQAKKSHSIEWLFLYVWCGKRGSRLARRAVEIQGISFMSDFFYVYC